MREILVECAVVLACLHPCAPVTRSHVALISLRILDEERLSR
ncbi:hypothetical protein HMPREF1316_0422 [Olsenella profusa F0195]|uniref:Uncharacterized protein n=1 Tax=Olsenella profusa F0195 TaxID=1125712 RepID=U2TRB2_9ACTN|nr:hypothetical protein HMPREF1316_0422 [Olsenella profusa F0195]